MRAKNQLPVAGENQDAEDTPIKFGKSVEKNRVKYHNEKVVFDLQSATTFGTVDQDCCNILLEQVFMCSPVIERKGADEIINGTTPMLFAIKPRDELEGMLAVQIVATHNLAMEMARRAANPKQDNDGVSVNVNMLTKLNRTFIAQIETLNRHRGKGQQKMTVEHIHVSDGGQAIIGNVDGGGKNEK
ncbi:hypothetical protein [Desulfocastanea catecholica]